MTKHDFFEQRKMYYVYDKINKNSVYPHNLLIQIIRDLVSFHLVKLKYKVFLPDCFQNGNYLHYLVILVYACKRVSSEMQNKFLMHQQMINVSLKLFLLSKQINKFYYLPQCFSEKKLTGSCASRWISKRYFLSS